jgi:DNA-directed RNA polymerase, alpha subunit/40 kD subunit
MNALLNFDYKIIESDKNFTSLKIVNDYLTIPGLAITIGNSLRRILLGCVMGTAVVNLKVNKPENDSIFLESVREDFFDIINNIKKISLRASKSESCDAKIVIKGPAVVTAGDLIVPKHLIIVNPQQYLFTIVNDTTFDLGLKIEQGFGYKFYNENYTNFIENPTTKIIDANFSPVTKVNYKVLLEESYSFPNKMVESLILEIWTNGSITPIRAFLEANKILSSVFTSLIR